MPSATLKSLAKKSGKSLGRAEHLWDKAKEIVNKEYPDLGEKSDRHWALVVGIVKKMMGLKEGVTFKEMLGCEVQVEVLPGELVEIEEGYDTSEKNREHFDDYYDWAKAVAQAGADTFKKSKNVRGAMGHEGECGEFDREKKEGWLIDKWSMSEAKKKAPIGSKPNQGLVHVSPELMKKLNKIPSAYNLAKSATVGKKLK